MVTIVLLFFVLVFVFHVCFSCDKTSVVHYVIALFFCFII